MLQVRETGGPPAETQHSGDDGFASRFSDQDLATIGEIFGTPLIGSYTWDYATANAKIRRLCEFAARFGWTTELDIDWNQPAPSRGGPAGVVNHPKWKMLSPERKLEFHHRISAQTLSQFLHGEQGALMVASQLMSCAPSQDARLYAASRIFEKARHVEAFHTYLTKRCGMIYPINPCLKLLLDKVLSDRRWDMKFIGMQVLIEGLALAAFRTIHQVTGDPLLKQVVSAVARGEGRRMAFGVNYIADWIRALPQDQIEERARFAFDACVMMRDQLVPTNVAREFGFTEAEALKINGATDDGRAFRTFLFESMIPNLKRVGLLTDRIRPKFESLGVLQFENLKHDGQMGWDALEALPGIGKEVIAA